MNKTINTESKNRLLMNRRDALKASSMMLGYALTASTISGVMSGCKADNTDNWVPKYLTLEQSTLLDEVSEMIIPATDIPGAKAAKVNRFIDAMCEAYSEEDRNKLLEGLSLFDLKSHELNGKTFVESDDAGRKLVLDNMVAESKASDDPHIFNKVKELTVTGYCSSEIGGTELLYHDPVPGPFQGCIDVNSLDWPYNKNI